MRASLPMLVAVVLTVKHLSGIATWSSFTSQRYSTTVSKGLWNPCVWLLFFDGFGMVISVKVLCWALGDLLHVPVALFAMAETYLSVCLALTENLEEVFLHVDADQWVPTIRLRNFRIWRCQDVQICCYQSLPLLPLLPEFRCRKKITDGSVAPYSVSLQRNARSQEKNHWTHGNNMHSRVSWVKISDEDCSSDKKSVMVSATLAQNHLWLIRQGASYHTQTLHDTGTQRGELLMSVFIGFIFTWSQLP